MWPGPGGVARAAELVDRAGLLEILGFLGQETLGTSHAIDTAEGAVGELGGGQGEDIATSVKLEIPTIRRLLGWPILARLCVSPSVRVLLVGRESTVVDRWFPSSRLCSTWGTVQEKKPLRARARGCVTAEPHDRDVNAAKSFLAADICGRGAGARPQRSTTDEQLATKQRLSRHEP